uniref:Uncharacterized protein n=1 Tax=Equus caballus TaxID=9796 RepID=A0A9L0SJZ9_HORSE
VRAPLQGSLTSVWLRPLTVTLALRSASRCLAKPAAEPADAQATRLRLDCRLELVILPNEPHQLLQFLIFPHQPLYLMPKPLIIGQGLCDAPASSRGPGAVQGELSTQRTFST